MRNEVAYEVLSREANTQYRDEHSRYQRKEIDA